jgi:hypothetical protein
MWRYGLRGLHWDIVDWPTQVLDAVAPEALAAGPEVLGLAAVSAWLGSDPDRATRLARSAIDLAEQRGEPTPTTAHEALLYVAGFEGDFAAAIDTYVLLDRRSRESSDTYQRVGLRVAATIGATLAEMADVADVLARQALDIAEASGNRAALAYATYADGFRSIEADIAAATACFERGAALARSVNAGWLTSMNLAGMATVLRRQGRHDDVLALLHELIGVWYRSHVMGQLRHSLYETALALDGVDDRAGSVLALRLADAIGLGFRILPSDRPALESLRQELGDPRPRAVTEQAIGELLDRFSPAR